MDAQRVNLDGFAVEDAGLGLVAMRSPHDPEPGLVIRDGRVTEMDGVTDDQFDSLDSYIARHGLDLAVAEEAMGLPDVEFGRASCRERVWISVVAVSLKKKKKKKKGKNEKRNTKKNNNKKIKIRKIK